MIKDISGLIEHVTNNIKSFTDIAVIGLSGGADSTLVAILSVLSLGKDNVHGVHLPYSLLDEETFNSKSKILAENLGIKDKTISIGTATDMFIDEFDNELSKINQGNMRSRMRMIALYTYCCQIAESTGKRVRVIGTGNLSEDFIGYDTKGGDSLCDIFPIGTLVKSEVYQLLEYFRDQGIISDEMIDRVPSAGLWDGQTDEDELGYTYNQMEPYVINWYNRLVAHRGKTPPIDSDDQIANFVKDRHFANKHKHEAPLVIELREFCE